MADLDGGHVGQVGVVDDLRQLGGHLELLVLAGLVLGLVVVVVVISVETAAVLVQDGTEMKDYSSRQT